MPADDDINTRALLELAAIKGQLDMMLKLLQEQHNATNRRIDDMNKSMDQRFDRLDSRVETLEDRERTTAIRTAATSAISAAVVSAGIALLKGVSGH